MEKVLGISILVSNYKNNDAVINILTKDGLISVLAKGLKNSKSKIYQLNNCFVYGEYDLYKGPTNGLKLRDCLIFNNYSNIFNTFEDHVIFDFLSESLFKTTIENCEFEKYFDLTIEFLEAYKKNKTINYALVLYYLAQIEKLNGIALNLSSCVQCGNVDKISGIDFVRGGVVCEEHFSEFSKAISSEILNIYDYLFNGKMDDCEKLDIDNVHFKQVFADLYENLESNLGIKLKSVNLINLI